MSSDEGKVWFKEIFTFSDECNSLWQADGIPPAGATVAILIIDISKSMNKHIEGLRLAVAAIVNNTNVPKNFNVPDPNGCTGMVQAIEQIVRMNGSNQATTFYLVGDGGENLHAGSLPIGLNSDRSHIWSPHLDFRDEPIPMESRATHYRALVNYLKFKRITLVMLALGDSVKSFLDGLSNTKDIYLAHLDFNEDVDNMLKIAVSLKKQARKGVVQTTLIQVNEVDKNKGSQLKMTSQARQKIDAVLGNITVGSQPRAVQALSGAQQLEATMNSVIDAYLAEPQAISYASAKEFRMHINAHLLFFMIKCVANTAAPAVIVSGKQKLVIFPDGCHDGTYSSCLNKICNRLAKDSAVLKKEPDTPPLGITIDHQGIARKFGGKCAQYSCVFQLSAVQELAANAAFCVPQHKVEAPPKAVKRQKV